MAKKNRARNAPAYLMKIRKTAFPLEIGVPFVVENEPVGIVIKVVRQARARRSGLVWVALGATKAGKRRRNKRKGST